MRPPMRRGETSRSDKLRNGQMGYLQEESPNLAGFWVLFDQKQHPDTVRVAAFSAVIKVSYQFVSLSYYTGETFCVFNSTLTD